MFDTRGHKTPGLNWNIGSIELSEKCSILLVFKIITKYFQYENLFFYLGSMPIYKTQGCQWSIFKNP